MHDHEAGNPPVERAHGRGRTVRFGVPASILCALFVLGGVSPTSARADSAASQRSPSTEILYVVGTLSSDSRPRILSAQRIPSTSSLTSDPDDVFVPGRARILERGGAIAVEVVRQDRQSAFRKIQRIETSVRGEFHGAEVRPGRWAIEGTRSELEEPVFVVRTPYVPGSVLHLETRTTVATFPVASLLTDPATSHSNGKTAALAAASTTSTPQSLPDNRVDLLVMGDGYTAAQEQKFLADADTVVQGLLAATPYSEYSNYIRVHKLFTASTQSGTDHPPYVSGCPASDDTCCADTSALSDPLAGQFVDTAFDSHFCENNLHRLLVADLAAVYSAAAAVPEWDQILLIVNDTTYGGSGGSFSTLSLHSQAVQVAAHEYGHSFTRLADEYDSPYPGYPACNDSVGPFCEANVTDVTNPSVIKWAPWIDPSVPVPTPENQAAYENVVGLFEGARYLTTGMYRPVDFHCLMHYLGEPFCPVCAQQYVLVLYEGGWGTPSSGIETIEPGLENPALGNFRKCSGAVDLSVVVLGPQAGPAPSVAWLISGAPVPGATSPQLTYASSILGSETVTVRVTDETPLVHPSLENGQLTSELSWTVDTVSLPASIVVDNQTISGTQTFEACDTITAGSTLTVDTSGSLTLRAGDMIVLNDGFTVDGDGMFEATASPVFP